MEVENLRALAYGENLNAYQRALAQQEFKKLEGKLKSIPAERSDLKLLKERLRLAFKNGQAAESVCTFDEFTDNEFEEWFENSNIPTPQESKTTTEESKAYQKWEKEIPKEIQDEVKKGLDEIDKQHG